MTTGRPRIVADDAIPHLNAAFGATCSVLRVRGADITADHLRDADALLVRSVTRVDAQLVAGTPVRFVGSATAGIDHVDVAGLISAAVRFAHAPGCNADAVVEYVLTALLTHGPLRGPIGIVGHGQIGRRLNRVLRDLGVDVLVCDPPRAEAGCADTTYHPLETILRRCNTISLHVPRVTRGPHPTHHLLDAVALDQLRPGARIVNTSRGDVVDNLALQRWLDAGRGDAIVDVWEGEPNLRWSLVERPNVVVATPHIAGYSVEGKARGTAMVHAAMRSAFPELPEFDVGAVLPSPPIVDTSAELVQRLRTFHPLDRDDAAMRGILDLAPDERAAAFEQQRRKYPLRRELGITKSSTG